MKPAMSKMESASDIAEWYRGKSVLVTGATGFMGKVLVEKLLRSCPDVKRIFLLIREKNNAANDNRVREMLESPVFERIRSPSVDLKDKLVAVSGDISLPSLGLSDEDRHALQHSVSVVFHVAAAVKFNEPLRRIATINLEGTEAILQLCKSIKKLLAVVYVSTAYANCCLPVIEERVYPPPVSVDRMKHCLAGLDDDLLELITPRLIGKHPNTYTFSKALAEDIVAGYSNELPIVVVRPSMVTASSKEPKPGWTDSYGGPTAFIVSFDTGLLKSVYGRREAVADMIPVDLCVNLTIAAAWEMGTRDAPKLVQDVLTYNCVSGASNPLTWGWFVDELAKQVERHSARGDLMKSTPVMTNYKIWQKLVNFFNQVLPIALIDCFTWISGGKPRLRYYMDKINKTAASTEYFTLRGWTMEAKNATFLKNRMSSVDKEIFDFDVTKIDWKKYIDSYFIGVRDNLMRKKSDALNDNEKPKLGTALIKKNVHLMIFVTFIIFAISFYKLYVDIIYSHT